MPTKPLDRLMFAQGGLCFFCRQVLPKAEASVEHLVASANGGSNNDENCVACCKSINALLGSMSLKEKVQVVLNQKGCFKCPNGIAASGSEIKSAVMVAAATPISVTPPPAVIVATPAVTTKKASSVVPYSPEQIAHVISNLKQRGTSKPRAVATLTSTVKSILPKEFSESAIESLLRHLQARGIVKYEGTKVTYAFPGT